MLCRLTADVRAGLFSDPVDRAAVPDYFDVIAAPMDMRTIGEKLAAGAYHLDAHAFADDVRLIWTNCQIYNQKGSVLVNNAVDLC